MPSTASAWYIDALRTPNHPVMTYDMVDIAKTNNDLTTKTQHSGATTRTIVQVVPLALNATTSASVGAATGRGWRFLEVLTDSQVGKRRIVPAGTWSFSMRAFSSVVAIGQVAAVTVVMHRVAANGTTLTELFRATSADTNTLQGGTTIVWNASVPQIVLEPDETLQAEYWASSVGGAAASQFLTFAVGTNLSGVTLPVGFRTLYSKSTSESTTAVDAFTSTKTNTRNTSETLTKADAVSRQMSMSRPLVETSVASDATSRRVILVRKVQEDLAATSTGPTETAPQLVLVDGRPAVRLSGPHYTDL